MRRIPLSLACLMGVVAQFGMVASALADDLRARLEGRIGSLLKSYCFECHTGKDTKSEVDLAALVSRNSVATDLKLWQSVLQQVEEKEMPPKQPQPSLKERAEIVDGVREALNAIDWSKQSSCGRVTLPRLTKQEYNNTLRDLFGIDLRPGDLLLDDGQGLSGFTNDRDALFISPTLAEQYFDAADYALQAILALGDPPVQLSYEAEKMLMTERSSKPQELPGGGFGYSLAGAGQRTIYDEVTLPADGWYRLTVRCVGIGGDSNMRLRIDNQPRHDFLCIDGKPEELHVELLMRAGTHQMTWNIQSLPARQPSKQPEPLKKQKKKPTKIASALPANIADLVNAACATNTPALPIPTDATEEVQKLIGRLNLAIGNMQRRIEYLRIVTSQGGEANLRKYYNLLPERTEAMAQIKAQVALALNVTNEEIDRRLIDSNREKIASNQKVLADSLAAIGLPYSPGLLFGSALPGPIKPAPVPQEPGAPGVDWIRIEGPILPSGAISHRVQRVFGNDASMSLAEFLARAYRRPLREGEIERHLKLYEKATSRGEPHNQSLKLAFTAALTSPNFLFRDEAGYYGRPFTLNAHQLANRLSYFLWLSMPDDELRQLADSGALTDDSTLRTQVRRMLADPKSDEFIASFLGQWLDIAGIGVEHVPDAKKFSAFSTALAASMRREPLLVFGEMLRKGKPLTQLLDSRETFVDRELAELYGFDDVSGPQWKRVRHTDNRRGGLLGMAGVLTTSSTPNRTSPVLRGKWVLENLLGRELAEPPADAGQLDDKAGSRGKTLREELAAHRRNESCAGCHDKIDPIGFGLENFDAIGRLREAEEGLPIDTSGQMPGGIAFQGPAELRNLLVTRHQDEFLLNVIRRMTAFALGRALRPDDEGLVHGIFSDLRKADYRADVLVESIVLSEAFQKQGD